MAFTPGLALLLLGLVAISALTGAAAFLLTFDIAHRVTAALRGRYVDQLLHAPMQFHRDESAGELIERLASSIADIEWFIRYGLGSVLGVSVILLGARS
jgi:ABC-type multidrug transport system fused ATPase/permease subunit